MIMTHSLKKPTANSPSLKVINKGLHPRCRFCEERFTCETALAKRSHVIRECAYAQAYERDSSGETLGDFISRQKK